PTLLRTPVAVVGDTRRSPALRNSEALTVPLMVMRPLAVLVPPLRVRAWPAALVSWPLLVKFVTAAGPVWLTVVLVAVLAPLRAVPPASTNVPPPRKNPPLTVAPSRVNVT